MPRYRPGEPGRSGRVSSELVAADGGGAVTLVLAGLAGVLVGAVGVEITSM
jgi:hypothetical protein